MQEELQALCDEIGFTMLFVTRSIEGALVVGNRIPLLSPHPGGEPLLSTNIRSKQC